MVTKYFTCGSRDTIEGLTLAKSVYDDEGNLIMGFPSLYKQVEITEEEYIALQAEMRAATKLGVAGGLLSETGLALLEAKIAEVDTAKQTVIDKKIARITKWAAKQDDVDIDDIIDKLEDKFPKWSDSKIEEYAQEILDSLDEDDDDDTEEEEVIAG